MRLEARDRVGLDRFAFGLAGLIDAEPAVL